MSIPSRAFLSYARLDDEHARGFLSALREQLADELRSQAGKPFDVFQDVQGIRWGEDFRERLARVLAETSVFIPVVTPSWLASDMCRWEFEQFAGRERKLGRQDLIMPLYFIDVDELERRDAPIDDAILAVIAQRNRKDLRDLRMSSNADRDVREMVAEMARDILAATKRQPPTPGVKPKRTFVVKRVNPAFNVAVSRLLAERLGVALHEARRLLDEVPISIAAPTDEVAAKELLDALTALDAVAAIEVG